MGLFLEKLADLYILLLVIRAVLSWFSPDPYHPLYRFLINVTEPVLSPLRSILPDTGIDFSPLVAILLIQVVVRSVIKFAFI
ncbi:MAG: YggT family protein [Candidatus Cloacimonas sp.]|jgi:YggT family protein|nr:YggT family protein [Candidatus Cloacimonadota bacterium]